MFAPSIPVNFLYICWAHSATAVNQNDYNHENGEMKKQISLIELLQKPNERCAEKEELDFDNFICCKCNRYAEDYSRIWSTNKGIKSGL